MSNSFLPLLPHSGHEGKGRGYNWGTKAEEEYHGHWPHAYWLVDDFIQGVLYDIFRTGVFKIGNNIPN